MFSVMFNWWFLLYYILCVILACVLHWLLLYERWITLMYVICNHAVAICLFHGPYFPLSLTSFTSSQKQSQKLTTLVLSQLVENISNIATTKRVQLVFKLTWLFCQLNRHFTTNISNVLSSLNVRILGI